MARENNAESPNSLRRAVWFAWLRQDVWAALQVGRAAMTIWKPKRKLSDLSSDELAARILYISAKAVQFAANHDKDDVGSRIGRGKALLQMLEDWYNMLPPSFRPIAANPSAAMVEDSDPGRERACGKVFPAIWIHPQSSASAIQTYHFSRTIVLLHETTTGGPAAYRAKERMLSESLYMICGIASAAQSQNLASAQCSLQALFAGTTPHLLGVSDS